MRTVLLVLAILVAPQAMADEPDETVHKWSAGISYDPRSHETGLWIDRDLDRLRVGIDVHKRQYYAVDPIGRIHYGPKENEVRVKIGFQF